MKPELLQHLKNASGFVSGEELSARLGVTRAAVWKAVTRLREEGYVIESATNRGYRLTESPDLLTEEEILDGLQTKFIGHKVFYYSETDSTNLQARLEAAKDAPDGSVFLAESQTAGRGRMGKAWVSQQNVGIWMSVLLRPAVAPQEIMQVTLAAGLAVCMALREATGVDARIKWPNDIVAGGRKLCGILTEMQAEAESIRHMVVGMGINVNTQDFPVELQDMATSLFLESGKIFARKPLVQRILPHFEQQYELLLSGGFEAMRPDYQALCATLGRQVCATARGNSVTGLAKAITASGDLVIQTGEGDAVVTAGEVSVRGIYGYL